MNFSDGLKNLSNNVADDYSANAPDNSAKLISKARRNRTVWGSKLGAATIAGVATLAFGGPAMAAVITGDTPADTVVAATTTTSEAPASSDAASTDPTSEAPAATTETPDPTTQAPVPAADIPEATTEAPARVVPATPATPANPAVPNSAGVIDLTGGVIGGTYDDDDDEYEDHEDAYDDDDEYEDHEEDEYEDHDEYDD